MRSSYTKLRARGSWDFALAGIALAADVDSGMVRSSRIVLSGVAPVPWRSKDAENALNGSRVDPQLAAKAAAAATAAAQPMAKNAYKVQLARTLVEDAVLALA
jgi:xanthine dehydrogenase YagS FAD-binding subunit